MILGADSLKKLFINGLARLIMNNISKKAILLKAYQSSKVNNGETNKNVQIKAIKLMKLTDLVLETKIVTK